MSPLAEVTSLFLKLGFTAFGGPADHIAMASLALLLRFKVNTTWLIADGAVAGYVASNFRYNLNMPISPIYTKNFVIPPSAIDGNGHVNNVAYVQWMQDIAVEHYSAIGGVEAQGPDCTWVVREHRIEYLLPAFENEQIEIRTWVENLRRVSSLRKYEFARRSDGRILVRGETDWVFVDVKSGRPRAVPKAVVEMFGTTPRYL